jgi:hypothetical protein
VIISLEGLRSFDEFIDASQKWGIVHFSGKSLVDSYHLNRMPYVEILEWMAKKLIKPRDQSDHLGLF